MLSALRVPGVDVNDLIQLHRRYLVELMQQWTHLKDDEADFDLAFALVVDAELSRLDSVIRWLDQAEGRLMRAEARTRSSLDGAALAAKAGGAPMSFLELRNISKSYGAGSTLVHALVDASLSVDRGNLVAVMGPSGSGKSSLLTIAGSLEEPTSGEVLIDGKSLASMSHNDKARLRRRTIGYVFQDFNLLAGLTALENVSLPLELDDLSARKARTLAMTALENVGIAERAGHFPDELSGGERQRVAIARAVVGERHLLLADEPSGALDSANGEAVMKMIRGACKQGVAAVVVTHDAHLASWADRVVFLKDGRIVDQTVPPPSAESLLAPTRTS